MPKKSKDKDLTIPKDNKNLTDPIGAKKVREVFAEMNFISTAPQNISKKAATILEKLKRDWKLNDEDGNELTKYYVALDVTHTHALLGEAIRGERDRTMIMEFADDLIEEFQCTKVHERALCEIIALHYLWIMKTTWYMESFCHSETLSEVKNGYYAIIGKELDRHQRMYLHSLQTLQAMKSPPVNISFKANNAFIAQNQQFNNNPHQLWANQ